MCNTDKRMVIKKITVIFFISLLLFTFFSRSISNFLLPEVTVTSFHSSSINTPIELEGRINFCNKEKIFAQNELKIKEIVVQKNQYVKKGDVLAVVEGDDDLLTLDKINLEILKLQNQLDNYKNSFEDLDLSKYKRELQLAERNMTNIDKDFNDIKKLYELGYESKRNYESLKQKLDDANYLYNEQLKILRNKEQEQKNAKKEYENIVNEKSLEIELKKKESFIQKYNLTDGKIVSKINGTIISINVDKGKVVEKNEMMFEIASDINECKISWLSNYDTGQYIIPNMKLNISVRDKMSESMKHIEGTIDNKEYNTENNNYEFKSSIYLQDIIIEDNQKVDISINNSTEVFDFVLPISCLTKENNETCIYIIEEKEGVWGIHKSVRRLIVKILYNNDYYCAIDGFFYDNEQVVVTSTEPLENNMQVKLR